jgi:hypothetical protein
MPTELPTPARIAEIRRALGLEDSVTEDELCLALNKSRRALRRMGIPFKRAGKTRIHNLNQAREAIAA